MKKNTKRALVKVATSSAVLAALAGIAPQHAEARTLVDFNVLGSGSQVRSNVIQSLGGEFQVADDTAKKEGEGKCGESKCGSGKGDHGKGDHGKGKGAEGKCGESKCGSGKGDHSKEKAPEGKCGEGKCGDSMDK